jgi:hypothetical protein
MMLQTQPNHRPESSTAYGLPPYNKGVSTTLFGTLLSYDTVRFYVSNASDINRRDLKPLRETVKSQTGEVTVTSQLKNLIIKEFGHGVSIEGSLPKFLRGENLTPLTLDEVEIVMDQISDLLQIDVRQGRIRRLDVGANLIMEQPVGCYLATLSSAPRCDRIMYSNQTVNFFNGSKCLTFYDKLVELKHRNKDHQLQIEQLMVNLGSPNVLRYEYQGRDADNNFRNGLPAHQLTDRGVFVKVIATWKANYHSILKCRYTLSPSQGYSTIHDLTNQVLLVGIENIGGIDRLMEQAENLVRGGSIRRHQKSRFKMKLKQISENSNDFATNELVEELDKKVEAAYDNALAMLDE